MDDKKYNGLKEKIDEKEKLLIETISEQVADNINDNLSESIESIAEIISSADEKAHSLNEAIGILSQNVKVLNEFDFTEQFTKVKNSQELLVESSQEAKAVLVESKEANSKFVNDISNAHDSWITLKNDFIQSVNETKDCQTEITSKIEELNNVIASITSLDSQLTETVKEVEKQQLDIITNISQQTASSVGNIINEKIDRSSKNLSSTVEEASSTLKELTVRLEELANSIQTNLNMIIEKSLELSNSDIKSELDAINEDNKNILKDINEIKNTPKLSPVTIITAVMTAILIIMNIALFIIK